ncbi:hypothetical protein [Shimia sp.]|uniref:hypothetical protein n=1 Tax=Shimia sp. TaxID=1954381 RepID=UPI003BA98F4B
MKNLSLLLVSGVSASALQLLANFFLYKQFSGAEFEAFYALLLLSASIRPLATLKMEAALFRNTKTIRVFCFVLCLATVVSLGVGLSGWLLSRESLTQIACIIWATALNEVLEMFLVKQKRVRAVSAIRITRPLFLIFLAYLSLEQYLDRDLIVLFFLSYIPGTVAGLLMLRKFLCYLPSLKIQDGFEIFKGEYALLIYNVPAAMGVGFAQFTVFQEFTNRVSSEMGAQAAIISRFVDAGTNIFIPNLRLYLLRFVELSRYHLFVSWWFSFTLASLLILISVSPASVFIQFFAVLSLFGLMRALVTVFGTFAYQKRKDYFVLLDAGALFGFAWFSAFYVQIGNPLMLFLYPLSSAIICLALYFYLRKL